MSRLDKEFKDEVKQEFAETGYIVRKMCVWLLVAFIAVMLFGGISRYISTNVDRVIFKQSVTYNEGVLDDLAKYKLEMIQSETEVEKKAIANMVVDRFANYDESKIESYDLKQFLKDCRNLDVSNY